MKTLKQRVIFVGILLLVITTITVQHLRTGRNDSDTDFIYAEPENPVPLEEHQSEIVVHVAGAVSFPGVYTLQEGQRIEDALQLAGLNEDSDIDALNRASVLTDGQKIVVPSIKENNNDNNLTKDQDNQLLDLNQSDLQQLMELPGIGAVKAQAILDYRAQQGRFNQIEDLLKVNGIGEAIFEQIKNKIKI